MSKNKKEIECFLSIDGLINLTFPQVGINSNRRNGVISIEKEIVKKDY